MSAELLFDLKKIPTFNPNVIHLVEIHSFWCHPHTNPFVLHTKHTLASHQVMRPN